MSYPNLIDIGLNVDTQALDSIIEEIRNAVEDKMDHEGVQDVVREWLSDNDYVTGDAVTDAVSEALDGKDYQDSDDVQQAIDSALSDFTPEPPDDMLTEADVEGMIEQALQNDEGTQDLERRLGIYAQHVDQLRGERGELLAKLDNLSAKLDALSTESSKGLTLLDLLRQAYRIISGG